MFGFWDSTITINASNRENLKTEAEKTNNYDKYNKEFQSTQKLIKQKKKSLDLVLKQDRFKSLKIKLEKMKKERNNGIMG